MKAASRPFAHVKQRFLVRRTYKENGGHPIWRDLHITYRCASS